MANDSQVLDAIDSFMDDVVDEIFSLSQMNLVKNGSVDSGQLLKSGAVNRKFLEKEIVYTAPQAIWIEFGTHPHPVSKSGRENLKKWFIRKLGLTEKEAESASWGLANRIRMEGSQAKPFLRPALDEVLNRGVSK